MANVNIVLTTTNARVQQQTVSDDAIVQQQDITPSASSQTSSIQSSPNGYQDQFWEVTSYGGNIRVLFGPNGTVTVANNQGRVVLDGQTKWFRATQGGWSPAIIVSI